MAISRGCKSNSNSSMHAMFFLIILLFSTRACCDDHPDASKRSNCLESERIALLAIKSDLYNSDHWLSSWSGYDCCNWSGVACDNTTGHVIMLDVHYPLDQYASYPGKSKVNPSLFELKHLKYLDLSSNNFATDQMPKMISSLVHLEYLNLSNAMFDGLIPQQLGNLSNLHFLDLSGYYSLWSNDLSWLSHLNSLEYLDMSWVNLSTTTNWHHQINFHSLEHLALSYCRLPDAIEVGTNISMNIVTGKLKHLELAGNSLTKVPLNMGSFFHLEYLDLSQNYITDVILLSMANLTCLEHLDLHSNRITGEIPLSMGNFSSLLHLDVSYNGFFGGIPDAFGNLTSLLFLDLSSNKFYGCIPYVLGNLVNLEELDISYNNISCQIPGNIGRLYNLRYFQASLNNLMGQIPLSLGDLCNLEVLDLYENNIGGELANLFDGLSKCPQGSKLLNFDIHGNKLMGHIPLSLGDLCNLEVLDLHGNNIGGELANLLDGLSKCPQGSKLQLLYIYQNKFNGSLPSSLGQLAQLAYLEISSNSLQGNVTDAHFSQLTNLLTLDISYNLLNLILSDDWLPPFHAYWIDMSYCHLGTTFPSWIRTQTTLESLSLSGVELYGIIPNWFSDFIFNNSLYSLDISSNNLNGQLPSSLSSYMDLSNNFFEGTIPLSYAHFIGVRVLKLSNNHIHGSLPVFFCNFTNLQILHLSNNYLSGEVPTCHSSYAIPLESLHINNNNFSGPFPPALKNYKGLIGLDLSGNKFSGEIPKWMGWSFPLLKILCLSSNSFHGAIPVNIGNLTNLQVLDLSSNKLTGSIPSTIANFSSMTVKKNYGQIYHRPYLRGVYTDEFRDNIPITAKGSTNEYTRTLGVVASMDLSSIDLSNNELSGEIPKGITKLHGLCFLNLSNNHLTGRIPKNIGNMSELESLDLSMNRLMGEIPSSLSSLSFLSFLNLSYNELSGRIPTGGQLSTFNDSMFAGNKGLCGMPLPACPSDESNHHSPSQIGENEEGDKLERVLNYTFIVMGFIVGFWAYFGMLMMKQSIKVALFQLADKMYDWVYVQLSLKIAKAKLKLKWQK